jgi:hypothetical protein
VELAPRAVEYHAARIDHIDACVHEHSDVRRRRQARDGHNSGGSDDLPQATHQGDEVAGGAFEFRSVRQEDRIGARGPLKVRFIRDNREVSRPGFFGQL